MRRLVLAVATAMASFLGWEGAALAYEPISAENIALVEQCGATVLRRQEPTLAGQLYGALFSPDMEGNQRYSRGIGVVIGVSQYSPSSGFVALPGVKKDVATMQNLMISQSGGDLGYDVVISLTDENVTGPNVACLVQNALPTLIDKELDRLLFYWAGHGLDNGQKRGYLPFYDTPSARINDFTALPMLDLQEWAKREDIFGSVRQAVFVIDACVSGLATGESRSAERLKPMVNANLVGDYEGFLRNYSDLGQPVHVMFTAADKSGPTRETPEGGYFTQEFVKSLTGTVRIADDNGVVGHYALALHMVDKMEEAGNPPKPQVKILSGASEYAYFLRPDSPLMSRFARLQEEFLQKLRAKQEAQSGMADSGGVQKPVQESGPNTTGQFRLADEIVSNCTGDEDNRPLEELDEGTLREYRGMCRQIIKLNELNGIKQVPPYLTNASLSLQLAKLAIDQADDKKAGTFFEEASKEYYKVGDFPEGAAQAATGMLSLADMIYNQSWPTASGGSDERMFDLAKTAYDLGDKNFGGHFYAWLVRNGRGTEKNPKLAVRLFEESFAEGNGSAANNIAQIYAAGELGEPDYKRAYDFYLKAGELGMLDGYLNAASLYTDGNIETDADTGNREALALVDKVLSIEPNHPWGLNFKGWMTETGRGGPADAKLGAEYYAKSLEAGFAYAGVNLAYLKRKGIGVPQDLDEAKILFTNGCNNQQARACANLADMMVFGEGYEASPELEVEAMALAERALEYEPKNGFAMTIRGYLLEFGRGVERDYRAAAEAYRQGGEFGTPWGWRNLGYMNRTGKFDENGVELYPKNVQAALEAFNKAGEQGDAGGLAAIGEMMLKGELGEVTDDIRRQAEEKLLQAEQIGNVWATELLGDLYDGAYGGTADLSKAVAAYKRAADQKSRYGLARLGDFVRDARVDKAVFDEAQLSAPWEYYNVCGDLGWPDCYLSAAKTMFIRGVEGDQVKSGEGAGLYVRPQGQEAIDTMYKYLELGAAGADGMPDAKLAMAALNLAGFGGQVEFLLPTGFTPSSSTADQILRSMTDGGKPAGYVAIGLMISGLLEGRQKTTFESVRESFEPDKGICIHTGLVLADAVTPIFPNFDCGWYDAQLPNWTIGIARAKSSTSMRAEPGRGTVLKALTKGKRVIYMPIANTAGDRWVKVQDEDNTIGWVSADFLEPITEVAAK